MCSRTKALPGNRVSRGADRFVVTEVEADVVEGGQSRKVDFVLANSTEFGEPVEHTAMAAIDGDPATGGPSASVSIAIRSWRCGLKEKVTTTAESVITVRIKHDSSVP